MGGSDTFANASVKIEVKDEQEGDFYQNDFRSTQEQHSDDKYITERASRKSWSSGKRLAKHVSTKPMLGVNKSNLSKILCELMKAHKWKKASGVLSVFLNGTPRGCSLVEDQRNFLIAMELHRRFKGQKRYQTVIKQMFEIRMSRLTWARKCSKKKQSIQLELALFYLAQGNIPEAYNCMKFLNQGLDSVRDPKVDLIYGLLLYQIWYSGLPEEMQIKDLEIHKPQDANGMDSYDGWQKTEMFESSNGHYAVSDNDAKNSSRYVSESSVGNNKVSLRCSFEVPKEFSDASPAPVFYMEGSEEMDDFGIPDTHSKLLDNSIFFSHGLDESLLPLRLKHSNEALEQSINSHRKLVNGYHTDAVKHLRLALWSTPPLLAALQPLVQLLLLGDQVEEAFKEIEDFCQKTDSVLPFRLKARLLECFCRQQTDMISSCHENVLKRDPTCNYSLERLIKMHKKGSYNTMLMLEMIALHLDAGAGNGNIWGELASCFSELLVATNVEHEDCISANARGLTAIIASKKIPKAFTEGHTRDSWRLRCRWWATRHFSRNGYMQEMKAGNSDILGDGDWKLLASKAACASHLYGPKFEYVITVLGSLRKEGCHNDQISFLSQHMKNSLKLYNHMD